MLARGDRAAAEEGAPQGGSAGGGSQKAAEAKGEEGAIAHGTHLATHKMHVHDSDVGTVRSKAAKQDKERVSIADMARRVRNWGIAKPQNAKHSAWTWGFKYARPPSGAAGFQNQALCLVDDLRAATFKLGKDNSPSALETHLQYAHPEEYAQMRFEEQRQLHLPQKHKATVPDSTLRVEMNNLEEQADNAKPASSSGSPSHGSDQGARLDGECARAVVPHGRELRIAVDT